MMRNIVLAALALTVLTSDPAIAEEQTWYAVAFGDPQFSSQVLSAASDRLRDLDVQPDSSASGPDASLEQLESIAQQKKADALVVIEVISLGQQTLEYFGESTLLNDVLVQARVLSVYDQTWLGRPWQVKTNYTIFNRELKAENAAAEFVAALSGEKPRLVPQVAAAIERHQPTLAEEKKPLESLVPSDSESPTAPLPQSASTEPRSIDTDRGPSVVIPEAPALIPPPPAPAAPPPADSGPHPDIVSIVFNPDLAEICDAPWRLIGVDYDGFYDISLDSRMVQSALGEVARMQGNCTSGGVQFTSEGRIFLTVSSTPLGGHPRITPLVEQAAFEKMYVPPMGTPPNGGVSAQFDYRDETILHEDERGWLIYAHHRSSRSGKFLMVHKARFDEPVVRTKLSADEVDHNAPGDAFEDSERDYYEQTIFPKMLSFVESLQAQGIRYDRRQIYLQHFVDGYPILKRYGENNPRAMITFSFKRDREADPYVLTGRFSYQSSKTIGDIAEQSFRYRQTRARRAQAESAERIRGEKEKRQAALSAGYVYRNKQYWAPFEDDYLAELFYGTTTAQPGSVMYRVFLYLYATRVGGTCPELLTGGTTTFKNVTERMVTDRAGHEFSKEVIDEEYFEIPAELASEFDRYFAGGGDAADRLSDTAQALKALFSGQLMDVGATYIEFMGKFRHDLDLFWSREKCASATMAQFHANVIRQFSGKPSIQRDGVKIAGARAETDELEGEGSTSLKENCMRYHEYRETSRRWCGCLERNLNPLLTAAEKARYFTDYEALRAYWKELMKTAQPNTRESDIYYAYGNCKQ